MEFTSLFPFFKRVLKFCYWFTGLGECIRNSNALTMVSLHWCLCEKG